MLATDLCQAKQCDAYEVDTGPSHRTQGGQRLCRRCLTRTRRLLADLPALFDACAHELSPRSRSSYTTERVAGTGVLGIELKEDALNARAWVLNILRLWTRLVVDELGVPFEDVPSVSNLARFLGRHADWLAKHPAAGDFADELVETAVRVRRVVDANPVRRVVLGACVDADCGGVLLAHLRQRDELLPSEIRCSGEHGWRPDQWLLLGRRIKEAC